jgi:hypothetical protein
MVVTSRGSSGPRPAEIGECTAGILISALCIDPRLGSWVHTLSSEARSKSYDFAKIMRLCPSIRRRPRPFHDDIVDIMRLPKSYPRDGRYEHITSFFAAVRVSECDPADQYTLDYVNNAMRDVGTTAYIV